MTRLPLLAALAPLALLAGCETTRPDEPIIDFGPPATLGTAVPIGLPVEVSAGAVVATPQAVVEDSRCPADAQCPWAGRLIVRTRIDGVGWRETADLVLGQPFAVRDATVTLVSAEPAPRAGHETQPDDYRFVYRGEVDPGNG